MHRFLGKPSVVGAIAFLASACVPDAISVPITGKLSNGEAVAGQATTRADGQGTFWVQVPNGFRCEGTYNAHDPNVSFVIPVQCSNGRRGEVVVVLQPDRMSATAIGKLDNGLRGRFVVGKVAFD